MQDRLREIESHGTGLVVVSADARSDLGALRDRFGLTYPMVSDPDLRISATYGVRQMGLDVALPATFVVGSDGKVEFAHVAPNPVDRLRTEDLLQALSGRR